MVAKKVDIFSSVMENNRTSYSVAAVLVFISLLVDVFCNQTFLSNNYQGNQLQNRNSSYSSSLIYGPITASPWPALPGSNQHITSNPTWVRPVTHSSIPLGSRYDSNPTTTPRNPSYNFNSRPETNSPQERSDVTDDDLREFSQHLLDNDSNNAGSLVTINYQSKTTSRSQIDEAPLPLLSVPQSAFSKTTIQKLVRLHDNYIANTNTAEHVTPQEVQEEDELLDALLNTRIMELTREFLIEKGKITRNFQEFRNVVRDIWFDMYPRGGRKLSSSGFEHVFVAEIRNSVVSGFHNWLYFNSAEQIGEANYLGYMKKINLGNNKGAIVKLHFKFRDVDKPVGSMFIGTSPEFEFALYTACFLIRPDRVCPLRLGGNRFIIRTFTYNYRGKKLIGSAFPEI